MLDSLKKIFQDKNNTADKDIDPKLAFSALLLEAGMMDGVLDEKEKSVIKILLSNFFELSGTETLKLMDDAVKMQSDSNQIIHLTRPIKENFSENQRIDIIEMMWQVILSDGEEHIYEKNLMRRVAGLLYISDKDSGIARKRAIRDNSG